MKGEKENQIILANEKDMDDQFFILVNYRFHFNIGVDSFKYIVVVVVAHKFQLKVSTCSGCLSLIMRASYIVKSVRKFSCM